MNQLIELMQTDLPLVISAVLCCIATGLCKKLILNKTRIDLTHSFDPTALLPFMFGIIFAAIQTVISGEGGVDACVKTVQNGIVTGALSETVYRLFAYADGKSLKQLLKDDYFSLCYNQLMEFTDARKRLISGELKLSTFIGQVQTLADNVKQACNGQSDVQARATRLCELMSGVFDDDVINTLLPTLIRAVDSLKDDDTANVQG